MLSPQGPGNCSPPTEQGDLWTHDKTPSWGKFSEFLFIYYVEIDPLEFAEQTVASHEMMHGLFGGDNWKK